MSMTGQHSDRDYQRSRVYDFERTLPWGEEVTLAGARSLVKRICKSYKIEPPTVVMKKPAYKNIKGELSNNGSLYRPWAREIRLGHGYGLKQLVVIHETAHHIEDMIGSMNPIASKYFNQRDRSAHGPIFVALIIHLYDRFLPADLSDMTAECNKRNIDFYSPKTWSPRQLPKYLEAKERQVRNNGRKHAFTPRVL